MSTRQRSTSTSAAKQSETPDPPPMVEIEPWVNFRLPATHPFHERWSVIYAGRAILTFGTEAEDRTVATASGWIIREERRGAA